MPSNYAAIRTDNERRYGTDIGRIGPILLSDRYDDRTHFIFELLQNAEDALARRAGERGPRSVRFQLTSHGLRVSHYGKPFDEADVRGICGIAESTKDLTAIGRFGIGFKSVYAFSDRPEIHSGSEDFAIERYVWPIPATPIPRDGDETVIVIPLRSTDPADRADISAGLQRLGARTLLFLRQIEEIEWQVEGGPSGLYLRGQPEDLGDGARRITVIGQTVGHADIEESWLVFSTAVATSEGVLAGYVELAFAIVTDSKTSQQKLAPLNRSPLAVFFPTVLETHLGFLVQGPYRTTPSRDNVPRNDPWNQLCVKETADALVHALRWLRENDQLDTGALRCLPLDRARFGDSSMFAPLFEATRRALRTEVLLPRFGGGHVAAATAKLARTQELRELFDASQLAALFGADGEVAWLTGEISQDRTPELRQYLIRELEIPEVTPEAILQKLDAAFLERQSDAWILRLYEFLYGQPALRQKVTALPLIRLSDGKQVTAFTNGQPQAFLPGAFETGFPTLRPAVCATDAAQSFLRSMGLTEPDPVDDVVRNVLPKYRADELNVGEADYDADVRRFLTAFSTDSKGQREKLLAALRETPFVMVVDTGDGHEYRSKPTEVYLATDRMKGLFAGVPGVSLVNDRYPCLRGEDVRELLEGCGATRYLRPIAADPAFTSEQLRELRVAAGCESMSSMEPIEDSTLHGLDGLLSYIQTIASEAGAARGALLWDALGDLVERRGTGVLSGAYCWHYYHRRSTSFDATFVRLLNETEWVPDSDGNLQRPELVLFDSLGWKRNPFLLSKIRFKPPILDQLARVAGIEPGGLHLLMKRGITSEAQIRKLLGAEEEPSDDSDDPGEVEDALKKLGIRGAPTPALPDPASDDPASAAGVGAGRGTRAGSGYGGKLGSSPENSAHNGTGSVGSRLAGGKRTAGRGGGRPFISYVAAQADEHEPDPDGLDQSARIALETRAIDLILASEPAWQRTPAQNPGFDLVAVGADGQPARWCEVKAMSGSLNDRPVGVSRAQFECARAHGWDYWLYVVEHAGDESPRIVRIQDPAGRARTFTFDSGWLDIAELDSQHEDPED